MLTIQYSCLVIFHRPSVRGTYNCGILDEGVLVQRSVCIGICALLYAEYVAARTTTRLLATTIASGQWKIMLGGQSSILSVFYINISEIDSCISFSGENPLNELKWNIFNNWTNTGNRLSSRLSLSIHLFNAIKPYSNIFEIFCPHDTNSENYYIF